MRARVTIFDPGAGSLPRRRFLGERTALEARGRGREIDVKGVG